uniref:transcription/translation regulatory transformer protein RfaH n=1 Tax=Marinobacterium profundum TaxID=1714300 RepID=UPI00082D5CFE|nr:transcription/translation regulatory transformer protein RfaH [Marinobacterium profundum]
MAVKRAWYLLQTKPRQDARALENLEFQGFDCFAPFMAVERVRAGKRCELSEPLFPGYIFIYLDQIADNWRPIRSTRGVSRLVTFNDTPLPIGHDIVDQLRKRVAGEKKQPAAAVLKPGDPVRVAEGPFAELDALFECYDGTERVVILLNLMQRSQRLVMPLANIRQA